MEGREISENDKSTVIIRSKDALHAVSFSPDGSRFLDAGGSLSMNQESFFLNEVRVKDVKFIGSASVRIWDSLTTKVIDLLSGHQRPVVAALFISKDKVATLSFDGDLKINCLLTHKTIQSGNPRSSGRSNALAYLEKQSWLCTTMGDETIRGWDVETGKEQFVLEGHLRHYFIWSIASHPIKPIVASGGGYGLVIIWDVLKRQAIQSISLPNGFAPYGLVWHPDGRRLFIATTGVLLVVDTDTGKTIVELESDNHVLQAVAVSPEGTLVASGGGGTVRGSSSTKKNSVIHVWNVKTGKKKLILTGHTEMVKGIVFKPNGKELLSVSHDGTLRQWTIN